MTAESNKLMARRFHEYFDAGDWQSMRSTLAPQLAAYAPGAPGKLDADGFEALGRTFLEGFSQSRTIIHEQVAEGDLVATRAEWTAVHTATFNGIPPTNRPIRMEVFVVDTFKDGKIAVHRGMFDVMGLLQQLGAMPVPAAA